MWMPLPLGLLFALSCWLLLSASALAQEAITPPRAKELPPIVHPLSPEEARALGPVTVVVIIHISEQGDVTEATLAEGSKGAPASITEAAIAYARSLKFAPALRGEAPLAVQLPVTLTYEPPPPPAPKTTAEKPAPPEEPKAPKVETPQYSTTVRQASSAERLRESAQAVRVVETEKAKQQTADLGEVLARGEGVGVRRDGGLGSGTRFSLNGLTDDQVRFLLDGLPLDLAGYPFGLGNVPVNLVQQVEIYRGVVPIRFGADALGGAVNLVTDQGTRGPHGSASYQIGAFGTHRVTLEGRHLHAPTGIFLRAGGFFDRAENNYRINVDAPNEKGKLVPVTVERFHDGYQAGGLHLELGVVNKPWAKRLLVRGFVTDSYKELQHNMVMTVPYGAVDYGRTSAGTTLRYEQPFGNGVSLNFAGGYSFNETRFKDTSSCVYDWYGQCVFARTQPGEVTPGARNQFLYQHNFFARANLEWKLSSQQFLRLALSPTFVTRTGEEKAPRPPETRNPIATTYDQLSFITGLEHELTLFDRRLENQLFVKDYVQLSSSREPLPSGTTLENKRDTHRVGLGDALRWKFNDLLQAKASYEWAVRLPRPDEAFGDGVLIGANPELQPERSHNLNVGLSAKVPHEVAGQFRADVSGFLRQASQLIVLIGTDNAFSYQNVYGARSLGVEGAVGWTSPRELLALDANATWQEFRNNSSEGAFGHFNGDRIPNRPYLFANASARLQFKELLSVRDELSLAWSLRYVHEFFRGWESAGLRATKQVVPSQTLQSLALTYQLRGQPIGVAFTAELQNLTDAKAYDFFGAQRPGRAAYFKTTISL